MSGYTAILAEAVPGLTQTQYDIIEDTMRHVVFHGTLDWQTREQLHEGARQAFAVLMPGRGVKSRLGPLTIEVIKRERHFLSFAGLVTFMRQILDEGQCAKENCSDRTA